MGFWFVLIVLAMVYGLWRAAVFFMVSLVLFTAIVLALDHWLPRSKP